MKNKDFGSERVYESFDDLKDVVERPRKLTEVELEIAKCFWNQAIRLIKNGVDIEYEQ